MPEDEIPGDRPNRATSKFEQQAELARESTPGPFSEFLYMLNRTRKWWMVPIILALLTVGALLVVSSTTLAPLIYAVF